jgi:RNA polymerase sigma-70 factor (ECF subfamily)
MPSKDDPKNEELLARALAGQQEAFEELFERNRKRLKNAIAMRVDRRLSPRVDASDIVQETYLEATKRLPRYFKNHTMPFYLWLRWIAREKIIYFHRRHVGADKRSISREVPLLPEDSSVKLAVNILEAHGPSPSRKLARKELAGNLQTALGQIQQDERELILIRHFEGLGNREAAQLLGIREAAASKRYLRALERVRKLLTSMGVSSPS